MIISEIMILIILIIIGCMRSVIMLFFGQPTIRGAQTPIVFHSFHSMLIALTVIFSTHSISLSLSLSLLLYRSILVLLLLFQFNRFSFIHNFPHSIDFPYTHMLTHTCIDEDYRIFFRYSRSNYCVFHSLLCLAFLLLLSYLVFSCLLLLPLPLPLFKFFQACSDSYLIHASLIE